MVPWVLLFIGDYITGSLCHFSMNSKSQLLGGRSDRMIGSNL